MNSCIDPVSLLACFITLWWVIITGDECTTRSSFPQNFVACTRNHRLIGFNTPPRARTSLIVVKCGTRRVLQLFFTSFRSHCYAKTVLPSTVRYYLGLGVLFSSSIALILSAFVNVVGCIRSVKTFLTILAVSTSRIIFPLSRLLIMYWCQASIRFRREIWFAAPPCAQSVHPWSSCCICIASCITFRSFSTCCSHVTTFKASESGVYSSSF